MLTDHFSQSRSNPPPWLDPLYTHGWTDIQTDGDYIKRVVHGLSGDHTLKKSGTSQDATVLFAEAEKFNTPHFTHRPGRTESNRWD